jgi:DNA polymerase I-like protein with 3'-5' exonuclease and polymerase domains
MRTEALARQHGFIENAFGARFYVLGRLNLPELLGWVPQSTVARVINTALVNIDSAKERNETSIQLLLQVHDSLAGQFLTAKKDAEMENLRRLARVEVPYPDPLIIPVGIKTSTKSWGDCK